ncbi:MAG: antimicrobial resistance protein Mig-14 [Thermoproteota archaeon]|nr:antimicrobial resistance protein Mig-14 [Thermoproteota archaeon]
MCTIPSASPLRCPLLKRTRYLKKHNVPSQNEQNRQEHNEDAANNILIREIESWGKFEYALRDENRLIFNKMLSECKENEDLVRAANSKDEFFSAESLFMALILQKQKTIIELITKASEQKKETQGS